MTDTEFEKLVAEGIEALPPYVREHMENVAITVAEDVTPEIRKEEHLKSGHTLFGLYHGVPRTERDTHYSALPDKITIFKKPILARCTTADEIRTCVANTVWHEVAHHFGFGEEWVEAEEIKRGKTL